MFCQSASKVFSTYLNVLVDIQLQPEESCFDYWEEQWTLSSSERSDQPCGTLSLRNYRGRIMNMTTHLTWRKGYECVERNLHTYACTSVTGMSLCEETLY